MTTPFHQLTPIKLDGIDETVERVRRNHHDCIRELQIRQAATEVELAAAEADIEAGAAAGSVVVTDITPVASDRLIGRDTAGSGAAEELTVGGGVEFTGSGGIQRSALTGDATASAGSNAVTIANDAVTNAKAANMADSTIKGRASGGGTGDPQDLTAAQVASILQNYFGSSAIYGSGLDGALVVSGTTTATREGEYTTVVVQSGGVWIVDGWAQRATVSITVDAGGVISCDGAASVGSVGGAGGGAAASSFGPGTAGGASNVGAGSNGTNLAEAPKVLPTSGATSGRGGAGGLGAGGAGGAAGTVTVTAQRNSALAYPTTMNGFYPSNVTAKIPGGSGGGGGGGNGAANANSGGGGGAGCVPLAAPTITNNGTVRALGGGSANAGNTNCGSGGSGGGGRVFLHCLVFAGNNPDVSAGTPGAKNGTGVQGATGSTGYYQIVTRA